MPKPIRGVLAKSAIYKAVRDLSVAHISYTVILTILLMQQRSSLIVALSAMLMERKRAQACSRVHSLAFAAVSVVNCFAVYQVLRFRSFPRVFGVAETKETF